MILINWSLVSKKQDQISRLVKFIILTVLKNSLQGFLLLIKSYRMNNKQMTPVNQAKHHNAQILTSSPLAKQYILPFQKSQKDTRTQAMYQPGHNIMNRKAPNITFNNTPNQSTHKKQSDSLKKTIDAKIHDKSYSKQVQQAKDQSSQQNLALTKNYQRLANNQDSSSSCQNRFIVQHGNRSKAVETELKSFAKNIQLDVDKKEQSFQHKQGNNSYRVLTPATQNTSKIIDRQKEFTPHHGHSISEFKQQNKTWVSSLTQTPKRTPNNSLNKKVSFRQLNQKQRYLKPQNNVVINKQSQHSEQFKLFNNYINYETADIIHESPNRKYSYHVIEHPTIEYKTLDQSKHSQHKLNKKELDTQQQDSNKLKGSQQDRSDFLNRKRIQISNHVYVQNQSNQTLSYRKQLQKLNTPVNQIKNIGNENPNNKQQDHILRKDKSFTYFNKNITAAKTSILQPARNRQLIFNYVATPPRILPGKAPQVKIGQSDRKWIRQFPQPQYKYFEKAKNDQKHQRHRNVSADNFFRSQQNQKYSRKNSTQDQKIGQQINQLSNKLSNIEAKLSNQNNCNKQRYDTNFQNQKSTKMSQRKSSERTFICHKQSEKQKNGKHHTCQTDQSQGLVYSFSSLEQSFGSGNQKHVDGSRLGIKIIKENNSDAVKQNLIAREKPARKYRIIQQRQKIPIINQSRQNQDILLKKNLQGIQFIANQFSRSGVLIKKASLSEFNAIVQKNQRQSLSRNPSQNLTKQQRVLQNNSNDILEEMITSVAQPDFLKKISISNQSFHCVGQKNKINRSPANRSITNSPKDSDMKITYYQDTIFDCFSGSVELNTHRQIARFHFLQSLQLINLPILRKYQQNQNQKFRTGQALLKRRSIQQANKKWTLVFDLDETLIHCTHSLDVPYQYEIPIKLPNGSVTQTGINIRPYALPCLTQLSKHFQLMIFTASHQLYADSIINTLLDCQGNVFSHKFYRDDCIKVQETYYNLSFYMKDLRVIDRDMQNMVLIDNAAYSYYLQLDNGVPMLPFFNNTEDSQLKHLTHYLKALACFAQKQGISLREANKRSTRLHRYRNQAYGFQTLDYNNPNNIKKVIQQIYQN